MRSVTPKRKLVNIHLVGVQIRDHNGQEGSRRKIPKDLGELFRIKLFALTSVMRNKFFETATDFRSWLEANHRKEQELAVGFGKKKSGRPSMTYSEAVDEALCFGWIDGVRNSIDGDTYRVRFTPRKPKSRWSAVNIKRVRKLMEEKKMRPSGLEAFAGAETQARAYSYEQRYEATLDAASARRFRANKTAWEFFQAQPPWYRRTATFWVISAKKQETRDIRLDQLITESARKKSIRPLERKPPSRSGTKSH
jgi:uncharacterized protein YdeI (YjbR/CyaY-like superfamily)